VLLGDVPGAVDSVIGFVKVWSFFGFTPEKANLFSGALVPGQKRCGYQLGWRATNSS
jgi:hypothetical protein